jgi:endonuclease YncB( thermonuclease family)
VRALAAALLAVTALLAAPAAAGEQARVARVVDGDTIELVGGGRVRLLQIDTPELGSSECYSRAAAKELRRLLPVGTAVTLEADPPLDLRDRYRRLLRYVRAGGRNVNVELVRRGAATVYFYRSERGRYASALLTAARQARAAKRGLWGACRAVWDPSGPATTSPTATARPRGGCDASYPDVCIPPPPPDLDCADVPYRNFSVLRDPPDADPHILDRNEDGVACQFDDY